MWDRRFWIVALIGMVVVILGGCAGNTAEEYSGPVTAVRLPMGYIPDPQYAPFYVAKDKGYFREAGFEVEFDYSFETDGVALVGAGELPFAIVSGDQVILARAQDLPVVYVMEWFQRFPIAVISKVEAGIERPEDLAGRTVGLPGFFGASYVGYAGLLEAAGLSQDDVNATDIGFTQVETLLADQADAVVGYANNEPLQLQALGQDINVIYVADEVDMVANGLITNEATIAANPDQVRRFVGAILKGLADTLADPHEAFEISKKYVEGLDDDRYGVLEASLPLWQSDTPGVSEIDSWRRTEEALLAIGFLDAPLDDLAAAFTNEFVE
jgi:NitT/TauT family transport system substrate-binding protein